MQGLKLIPKIKLDDSGVLQRLMISKECALEKNGIAMKAMIMTR